MNFITIKDTKTNLLNQLMQLKNTVKKSNEYFSYPIRIKGIKGCNCIRLSATDGYRTTDIILETTEEVPENFIINIHKEFLYRIISNIRNNKLERTLLRFEPYSDKKNIGFFGSNWDLFAEDLEYFPKEFDEIVKKYSKCFCVMKVPSKGFKDAINKSVKQGYDKVKISVNKREMKISSIDDEVESCLRIQNGDDEKVDGRIFISDYLLNTISKTGKNDLLEMTFTIEEDNKEPIIIEEKINRHIVLPIYCKE